MNAFALGMFHIARQLEFFLVDLTQGTWKNLVNFLKTRIIIV